MTSILHFADLHLDSCFGGIGLPSDIARRYRESLREALVRIIDLALEERVDAITIGGDLYEQERFTRDTGAFLQAQFARAAPIRIFIAPGNHDPWMADSLYQFLDWPENVTIFTSPRFTRIGLGADLSLWGMAHPSFSHNKNPLADFKVAGRGRHVLLFHGSDVTGVPRSKRVHAPFDLAELLATGADLALLGHYHRGRYDTHETISHVYPGSPEPLGFGEQEGEHSAALIRLGADGIGLSVRPVNKYRFGRIGLDVTGLTTREQIRQRLEDMLVDQAGPATFVRAELTGQLEQGVDPDPIVLQEQLAQHCAAVVVTDATRPAYELERIAEERTVRGAYVRHINALLSEADDDDKPRLERALICGLHAFARQETLPTEAVPEGGSR